TCHKGAIPLNNGHSLWPEESTENPQPYVLKIPAISPLKTAWTVSAMKLPANNAEKSFGCAGAAIVDISIAHPFAKPLDIRLCQSGLRENTKAPRRPEKIIGTGSAGTSNAANPESMVCA